MNKYLISLASINIIYVDQKLLSAIQRSAHNSIFKVPAMTHVPTFEREGEGEGGIIIKSICLNP
jgi:vacuolar-type H+-ATPase subunit F/Vma7